MRIAAWAKFNGFLKNRGIERSPGNRERVERAFALELVVRPLRLELDRQLSQFEGHQLTPETVSAQGIGVGADRLLELLRPLVGLVSAAYTCPLQKQAEAAIRTGQAAAYAHFTARYRGALQRLQAQQASQTTLDGLRNWFTQEWLQARAENLRTATVPAEELRRIADAMPTLTAYQNVRRRVPTLPQPALSLPQVAAQVCRSFFRIAPAGGRCRSQSNACARVAPRLERKDRTDTPQPAAGSRLAVVPDKATGGVGQSVRETESRPHCRRQRLTGTTLNSGMGGPDAIDGPAPPSA